MKLSFIENLKNLKLVHKLTTAYLILGLLTVISVAFVSYKAFEKALMERTFAQLSSINMLKKLQVENYFANEFKNTELLANSPELFQALLNNAPVSDTLLNSYLKKYNNNYNNKSIAILSNKLEFKFGANESIINDVLKVADTTTGEFKELLKSTGSQVKIIDLTGLLPYDKSSMLLTVAPVTKNERRLGAILVINSIKNLTSILYERTGMGETGESYIVAEDYRMRSRSRFLPEQAPATIEVRTVASEEALQGREGIQLINDYRGIPVLSVYRKLEVPGLSWVILSEVDKKEALKPIRSLRSTILIIAFIVIVVFFLITVYVAKLISAPVVKLKRLLQRTAKGILPPKPQLPKVLDEIGEMTLATNQLINALKRTTEFAYEIGNGNFEKQYKPLSPEDTLGISLIQMRDKLRVLTENEVRLIKENSVKLLEGQEEERKRISRELHDGIGQLLTTIRFKIGSLECTDSEKEGIRRLLDETIAETRRISNNLMPSVLIDFGLEAGLRRLIKQVEEVSGVKIVLIYQEEENTNIPFDVTTNVYRIVQEALNNVSKYSNATEAEVAVFITKEKVTVEVADNGTGFNKDQIVPGKGLKNMEERVGMFNGYFELKSSKERGTVIFLEIPLKN